MPNIVQTCVNYRDTLNLKNAVQELIEPTRRVGTLEYSLYNGGIITVKPNIEENLPAAIIGVYAVAFKVLTNKATKIRRITEQKKNLKRQKPWASSTYQELEPGDLIWAQAMYIHDEYTFSPVEKHQHLYQFEYWSCLSDIVNEEQIFNSMKCSLIPVKDPKEQFYLDKNTEMFEWKLMVENRYLEMCKEASLPLSAPTKINIQENERSKAEAHFETILDNAKEWVDIKDYSAKIGLWKQMFHTCMEYQYRPPFLKALSKAANDVKKSDSYVLDCEIYYHKYMQERHIKGKLKIYIDDKIFDLVVIPGERFKKDYPIVKLYYRYPDLTDKEAINNLNKHHLS